MKMYKGFLRNMTCRGFQFKEGETYEEPEAILCRRGFHACERPIDILSYYSPNKSVYREVELEDLTDDTAWDSKRCGKKITIGNQLDYTELLQSQALYAINQHKEEVEYSRFIARNTGDRKTSYTVGTNSIAAVSGTANAAVVNGTCGAAVAIGNESGACATNFGSAALSILQNNVSTTSGNYSAAIAMGSSSVAFNSGDCGVALATCDNSEASVSGDDSIAIATGYHGRVKSSAIGSAIFLCERESDLGYRITHVFAGIVDGETIKEDTWYTLKNGVLTEYMED